MWLSEKLLNVFQVAKETVDELRLEVSTLRSENDVLKSQLEHSRIMSEWLRVRVNQLEYERVGLLERAYQIKLPAPEIVRTGRDLAPGSFNLANLFDSLPLDDKDEQM